MKTFPARRAALILFLLALLLFRLGDRGLNEPDEGRYAAIAKAALAGSWLEPRLAGLGHYDKPPLIYGVTALGFYLFGLNEWAARLPSLFGALLTLGGLGWAAARLYGARVAWLAVLVGGTLFHLWAVARMIAPDMFLTGWCTLAVAAWVETRFRGGAWGWWALQVIFWSLALWTKATPALVPMLGLALYVYLTGNRDDRRALKLPILLPLALVLSCPWFIAVIVRHPELKNFFLHRELAARMTGHIEGRQAPVYFYFLTSLVAWLPWWPLALAAFLRNRRKAGDLPSWKNPEVMVLLTGFLVFSLIPSKLHTYTLPLAPWVALVMARLISADRMLSRPSVLGAVAGVAALVYGAMTFVVPSHESSFGANSSLKEVTAFLKEHHAVSMHADRFWPGLEFYWNDDFHFTGIVPMLEIQKDAREAPKHFEAAAPTAPTAGDWYIHYRRQRENPFRRWTDDPVRPKTVIGDFVVGPLGPG
jgi:4-amino-4-deoxy-L-arabinose transferase-like glycosyltransferase